MTTETLMTEAADTTESAVTSEVTETETDHVTTEAAKTEQAEDKAKAESEGGEDKAASEADDAPVEYAFELPEGVEMAPETLEGLKGLAGDLKLDQESANKVLGLGVEMFKRWEAAQADGLAAMRSEWAESTKADPEIGGANLNENLAGAKAALKKFATPELVSLLDESGLGNHPEVVRLFWKLNNQISDDALVAGRSAPVGARSRAEILYPTN